MTFAMLVNYRLYGDGKLILLGFKISEKVLLKLNYDHSINYINPTGGKFRKLKKLIILYHGVILRPTH